jgi:hypothetical protein
MVGHTGFLTFVRRTALERADARPWRVRADDASD